MLPTSTDVSIQVKPKPPADADAVIVFVTRDARRVESPQLSDADRRAVERLLNAGVLRGNMKEIAFDLLDMAKGKHRRVFAVGLGSAETVTAETIRQAAGQAARALRKHKLTRAAVMAPNLETIAPASAADAIVTGTLLASFRFDEYRGTGKQDKEAERQSLELTIVPRDSHVGEVRAAVERARAIADAQNLARTIANRPGNDITPQTLADVARKLTREVELDVRVLDEKQMAKLGMGGILAVGQGSANPPRMIVLNHRPGGIKAARARAKAGRNQPPILVVGKSITFDTGGISLKPHEKMGDMIFDKCGGMAVLGLMYAVAKLKLPIAVVGILAAAENMPGGRAYRPGDIVRMYNGVTVEVTNTDAEGRLVLGDALAWGIDTYNPAAVVDLATLTAGVVIALGMTIAGVITNSDALMSELQKAADAAGENIWRLPVGDDQRDILKSDHADIINLAGKWASPLQGGAFLSYFVPRDGSIPWAHLDIAGVADMDNTPFYKQLPYYTRGATGWGVRTLVEWVTSRIAPVADRATPRAAGG